MYLSNTNESIELVLEDPVITNQIQWMSIYNDVTSNNTIITPSFTDQGLSNNTTPVTIVFPPTGVTKREVIHLFIFNNDTADKRIIIRKKIDSNTYTLYRKSLPVNTTLEWSEEFDWKTNIINSGGGVSDGNKGDITVSSSGATWLLNASAMRKIMAINAA